MLRAGGVAHGQLLMRELAAVRRQLRRRKYEGGEKVMAFEREDANEGFSLMLSAEDEERERVRSREPSREGIRGLGFR